jgi:hypothetical protein
MQRHVALLSGYLTPSGLCHIVSHVAPDKIIGNYAYSIGARFSSTVRTHLIDPECDAWRIKPEMDEVC